MSQLIYEIFLIGIVLKNKGTVVSPLNYVVNSAILFFSGPASHKNTPLIILPGGGRFGNNLVSQVPGTLTTVSLPKSPNITTTTISIPVVR